MAYEAKPIQSRSGQTQTSDYTALHPGQKIPYLQDGELSLSESAAICIYLAERYGDGLLMPSSKNFEQRARVLQICFYAMTELDAHTLYVIAKHGGSLTPYYKKSNAAVEVAVEGFNKQIWVAEHLISSSHYYVLNKQFTIADILLGTCLISAARLATQFALNIPDKLMAYAENLQTRQAYQLAAIANQAVSK